MTERDADAAAENARPGFIDALRTMGVTALEMARARIELLSVEWQEERERGKEVLVLTVVGAMLLILALLVLTLFVIVLFWDSYRLTAIAVVGLSYCGGGIWALLKAREVVRDRPPPFAATLQEFSDDLKLLHGDRDHHKGNEVRDE